MSKSKEAEQNPRNSAKTVIAVVVIIAASLGAGYAAKWFTVEQTPDRTRIDLNTDQVTQDVKKATETGKQFVGGTGEVLEKTGQVMKEADDDS